MRGEYHKWTEEETVLLFKAAREHGNDWKKIQKMLFPALTRNQLRNKYAMTMLYHNVTEHQRVAEKTEDDVIMELIRILSDQ